MDPVTPRISSRPSSVLISPLGRLALFLHAVLDLGGGDLLQGGARRFLVLGVDARRGAPVELAGPLGRQHDEQITVRDLVERVFQRRERHQFGTSRSGKVRARRATRQRSAWMMDSSWSMASFTSRFTIR